MTLLRDYPFRVLIVDDEERDWNEPMRILLRRALIETGLEKVQVDFALDNEGAERLLMARYYHLSSFDMRLPERAGEAVFVENGLALARSEEFPKCIIYSQSIRNEDIREYPRDAASVLRLSADLYAKPTNADSDALPAAVEMLTAKDWARRVAESLSSDSLKLKVQNRAETLSPIKTVIGAYLTNGVSLLPHFLAIKLHELSSVWETHSSARVEAAISWIEGVMWLALVQSAALLRYDNMEFELLGDDKLVTCIAKLRRWHPQLSGWNWCNYLTQTAIDEFDQACWFRNDRYHTTGVRDHQKDWAELRVPLQFAMDIAAYWVRHPLLVNLRYSRDGWSCERLTGRVEPGNRYPLPEVLDFPTEAVQNGVWQNVWRLNEPNPPCPQALSWDGWMEQAEDSDYQCGFRVALRTVGKWS